MDGPNYVHPERHGSDAMMDGGMRKAFGAGDEKVMIWFSCFGHFDPKPNPTPPPLPILSFAFGFLLIVSMIDLFCISSGFEYTEDV